MLLCETFSLTKARAAGSESSKILRIGSKPSVIITPKKSKITAFITLTVYLLLSIGGGFQIDVFGQGAVIGDLVLKEGLYGC